MLASERLARRFVARALLAALFLAVTGCGADFDSPDSVKSLRVLAVKKDQPYAPPTTDPANPTIVNLSMLSHDGAQTDTENPRNIQRLWFSGCDDLPGDQYFTCLVLISGLWRIYAQPELIYDQALLSTLQSKGVLPRKELTDGESWSPLDDARDLDAATQASLATQLIAKFHLESLSGAAIGLFSGLKIGAGSKYEYAVPPGIIERHQASSDPSIAPFGLGFVFFSVCAGHVRLAPAWQNVDFATQLKNATLGFPLDCMSDDGTQLGPDDFVAGYTQQFVSVEFKSDNPVIDNANFDKNTANASAYCIGEACLLPSLPNPKLCDDDAILPKEQRAYPHVSACSGKCPTYDFRPGFDSTLAGNSFSLQSGTQIPKQMWINYFTDRGSLKHPVRLLRDATVGWNSDHFTTWTPPAAPGVVNLWAAVHDTRGGTDWTRLLVCVD